MRRIYDVLFDTGIKPGHGLEENMGLFQEFSRASSLAKTEAS